MNKITHIMKCLEILTMTDRWLHAYDFNAYGGVFIGHRGCVRISDAQKRYSYLIDVEKDPDKPRLFMYRLKWNHMIEAMGKLKEDDPQMYTFVKNSLLIQKRTWKEYRLVPEENVETRTVTMVRRLVEIT